MRRLYESIIAEHFQSNKQMAFVCGPRQVGKTTIARSLQHLEQQTNTVQAY